MVNNNLAVPAKLRFSIEIKGFCELWCAWLAGSHDSQPIMNRDLNNRNSDGQLRSNYLCETSCLKKLFE